jgi:thiol-disulfide isomerase/thioredoxin
MQRKHRSWKRHFLQQLFIVVLAWAILLALSACGGNEEAAAPAQGSSAAAASGRIRFLYFFSADCPPCQEMDPVIAGLETDFADKLVVERYDAAGEDGTRLMGEYNLDRTPSYVMLGADGAKLWSITGQIHKDMLRQQVLLRVGR